MSAFRWVENILVVDAGKLPAHIIRRAKNLAAGLFGLNKCDSLMREHSEVPDLCRTCPFAGFAVVSEGDHAATVAGVHGGNKDMSLRALPLVLVAGACVGEGPDIDIGWVDKTLGHGSSDRFCRVLNDNRSMVSGIMHTGSAGFGSLRRSMRRSLNRNRQGQQNYLVALLICTYRGVGP